MTRKVLRDGLGTVWPAARVRIRVLQAGFRQEESRVYARFLSEIPLPGISESRRRC